MNTTKISRNYVGIVFAVLAILMLTLSTAWIADPSVLAGTSSAQPIPPLPIGGNIDPQMLQTIMQQQSAVLAGQAQAKMTEIQQRNVQIQQITEQINAWRALNPGVTPTPEIQALINQLDQLNSRSQMDMLQLQSLMNQQNQSIDLITNLLNQQKQSIDAILRNLP